MFTINSKHTQFIHLYVCVSCLFEIHSYASRNKCFLNLVVVVVVGAPRNGTIYAYINYSLKTEFHHFTISLEQLCVKAKKSCFEIKRRKNGKPNDAVAEGRRGGGGNASRSNRVCQRQYERYIRKQHQNSCIVRITYTPCIL